MSDPLEPFYRIHGYRVNETCSEIRWANDIHTLMYAYIPGKRTHTQQQTATKH